LSGSFDVNEEIAKATAKAIWDSSVNLRDCIRIGGMAKQKMMSTGSRVPLGKGACVTIGIPNTALLPHFGNKTDISWIGSR
jgi:hypothetical protein